MALESAISDVSISHWHAKMWRFRRIYLRIIFRLFLFVCHANWSTDAYSSPILFDFRFVQMEATEKNIIIDGMAVHKHWHSPKSGRRGWYPFGNIWCAIMQTVKWHRRRAAVAQLFWIRYLFILIFPMGDQLHFNSILNFNLIFR